jgi:hypothetical protein
LHAGLGGISGLPRESHAHGSQGFGSIAHALVHRVIKTDSLTLPIGIREAPGALFERPSFSLDGCLDDLAPWRPPRPQWRPSCAKESDPVGEQSAPGRADRELVREDIEVHDAWDEFLCPWLDDREP